MISKDELAVVSRSSRPATATCYRLALRSLRAAEIQVARIWDRNLTVGSAERIDSLAQDVLIDVHFYFIALRGLHRFLEKIVNDPNFAHLQLQLEDLNQRWFRHYAAGREAFEHIDQRLPGEKHEHRLVEVEKDGAKHKTQYGLKMSAGLFYHSDASWDISINGFGELATASRRLLRAVADEDVETKPADAAPPV